MRELLLASVFVAGCTGYHEEITGDCTGGWLSEQPTSGADGVWWGTDATDGGGTAGQFVGAAGDLDGDGNGDFAVVDGAQAWVVLGPGCEASSLRKAEAHLRPPRGGSWDDWLLHGAVGAGDLDGDGQDALAVLIPDTAPMDRHGTGTALLFEGPVEDARFDEYDAALYGDAWDDLFWNGTGLVAAGDLDGDGNDDLVLGYAHFDAVLDEVGPAVHLLHGPLSGDISITEEAAMTLTVSPHPTQPAGDVFHPESALLAMAALRGAGPRSLVVPTWDEQVAVFLDLPSGGDLADADLFLTHGDARLAELAEDLPVEAADLDGDGYDDLLVHYRTADQARDELGDGVLVRFDGAGLEGGATEPVGLVECGGAGCLFYGLEAGDFDGDTAVDLLFDRNGDDEGPDQGILAGPIPEGAVSPLDAKVGFEAVLTDPWLESLAATDVDGDGITDVLFGLGKPEPGRVYVILGGGW